MNSAASGGCVANNCLFYLPEVDWELRRPFTPFRKGDSYF